MTIGEVLVEFMALEPGRGFGDALDLVGPFPSGAPAIFIDQVARLGAACGMIASVGDDDFGRLNIARLGGDGVDTRAIEIRGGRGHRHCVCALSGKRRAQFHLQPQG